MTPAFLDHVAASVRRALREKDGDVLVFVPGAGEVGGIVRRLGEWTRTSARCTDGSTPPSRTSRWPRGRAAVSWCRPPSPSRR
ncbi:hypothetical protein [Cellulomonas sp. ATA003]|uniref:hypothetical protein n=1 Tax=Cellulomonas sp. ATA003 TaxID=3073064 RepID=UPI002873837E|nr:hypothetical protein [Cellulomonas sp. ATA003]WNB86770.1 hypothetical protein REH70_06035 [Cellulomonas sp. ATA003]